MYSDGGIKAQCSVMIQGKRYGKIFLSETVAQRVKDDLSFVEDENGKCGESPLDYTVERVKPQDFRTQRQCIVILCRHCGSKIDRNLVAIPLCGRLAALSRDWVIDPDDYAHDPGCESVLHRAIWRLSA